jgi:hypothetical protein
MASGDSLFAFGARDFVPTATLGAAHGISAGGSTPAEGVPHLAFDSATAEYADVTATLPLNYGGGGITLTVKWASGATSNATVWRAAFRRVANDAEDVDTSHTYDYNSVTATTASAVGKWDYADITFTDGADMDSVAAGESFILRIGRDAANGSDDMTGDAFFVLVHAKET